MQERLGKALQQVIAAQPELSASSLSGALPMGQLATRRLSVGEHTHIASISPVDADFASVYGVQLQQGEWITQSQVERINACHPAFEEVSQQVAQSHQPLIG